MAFVKAGNGLGPKVSEVKVGYQQKLRTRCIRVRIDQTIFFSKNKIQLHFLKILDLGLGFGC